MAQYSRPPIKSRSLKVFSDEKDPGTYERLIPDWYKVVREDFPEQQIGKLWQFSVEEKEGVPVPKGKLSFLHRFVAYNEKKDILQLIEPNAKFLKLQLNRTPEKLQSFEDLICLAKKLLPRWKEHFGINLVKGVRLSYKNLLSKEITPLAFSHGPLKIDRWLTFMSRLPGRFNDVIGPFHTGINVKVVEGSTAAEFRYELRSANPDLDGTDFGVVVNLAIDTKSSSRNLSLLECLAEIDWCHKILLEQFNVFFTEEAKRNFE
jgi:hypothetical protein